MGMVLLSRRPGTAAATNGCRRGGPQGPSCRNAGFTFVEVLASVVLLSLLIIGILPLFVRSMRSNAEGRDLTEATNRARLHAEELFELPFDAPELTVPAAKTELLTEELYSGAQQRWIAKASFPAGERPLYRRTTRVRQFGVDSVGDGDELFEDAEALAGNTPDSMVHVKEIEVHVRREQDVGAAIGTRRVAVVRLLRGS